MTFVDSPDSREAAEQVAGMAQAGPGPAGTQPSLRDPFDIDICVAPHDEKVKLSVAKAVTKAIHTCWKDSDGKCLNEHVAAAVAQVPGCSAPNVEFPTYDHGQRPFLQ